MIFSVNSKLSGVNLIFIMKEEGYDMSNENTILTIFSKFRYFDNFQAWWQEKAGIDLMAVNSQTTYVFKILWKYKVI